MVAALRTMADEYRKQLAEVHAEYGYLFQNYALFDFMTVADNVAFPLRQIGTDSEAVIATAVRTRRGSERWSGARVRSGRASARVVNVSCEGATRRRRA